MPYQRGQFWIRRFRAQAEALCATLAALTQPAPAPDFVHRALAMLESTGWIAAHRFLFAGLRCHLLGWPRGGDYDAGDAPLREFVPDQPGAEA